MKEMIINDVLLRMQEHITREQLCILEKVLLTVLYTVEVVKMETALSTDFDDNTYMLDYIRLNMQKRDLSDKTIEQYMRTANNFLDVVHKNLRHVEPTDIEFYLNEYAKGHGGKPNSPTTINNERSFLSAVFIWLRRCNFVSQNPVESVAKKKAPKKPIDYLEGTEVEILRASCGTDTIQERRERAVMEFLLSTGARVGEVPDVKIEEINFTTGILLLYGHKDREYREVYISDAARVHIKRYLEMRTDNSPYLFVSVRGETKPIKECAIRAVLRKIRDKSELTRRIYPHLMRKTMASRLRQDGNHLEDIAEILGHANCRVTQEFYAAPNSQELRRIHRRSIA